MELNVSAIFPGSPVQEPGSLTEKSPFRMVCKPARITFRSAGAGSDLCTEFPFLLVWLVWVASGSPWATAIAASRLFFFIMVSWTKVASGGVTNTFRRLALRAACQPCRGTASERFQYRRAGEGAGIPQQSATGKRTTEIRVGPKHVECETTGIH